MAHDPISEDEQLSLPADEPRARSGTRHMLLAGVAGACVLGVGAGLWARPADGDRRTTAAAVAKVAEAPRPTGRLEIVVDDSPAPIGAPIEVLPAMTGQAADADAVAAAPEAEPLAPVRPPAGLVRVQSIEPLPVEAPPPPPAPKPAAKPTVKASAKVEVRKAEPAAPKARIAETRVAEAKAKREKVEAAKRADKATAERERERKAVRLAQVEAKAQAARKAKEAAKAQAIAKAKDQAKAAKLAKAKAAKAAQVAEAKKPSRLSKLIAKVTHHTQPAEPAPKVAKAKPKLKTEKAVLKRQPAPAPAKPAKIKRDSSFRLASNRCVSADPGEALVCADAGLGAADRQLNRAYRQAEAAGVSTATLARQQARWLSARAQAAREAPWAVRDVYEARIAELNDQTRDARREY